MFSDGMPGKQMLRRLRPWLANKYRQTYAELSSVRERFVARGTQPSGVRPENFIWIFGTGRGGSSWLRSMMKEMDHYRVWEEPHVGRLFGAFYNATPQRHLDRSSFILGNPTRKGWIREIRNFVLGCAKYAQPRLSTEDYLIIKEPNGSEGAPILMEAFPESRLIFLIRDPRDVVASLLDGARKGGWLYQQGEEKGGVVGWQADVPADEQPDAFVEKRAREYLQHVRGAKQAYDGHKGPKVLVRYEELQADTLGTMKRIYSDLAIPFDEEELARVVDDHSWKNIPEEKRGEGKFYRKGTSGGWTDDLTPEQSAAIEQITASVLREFYPAGAPRLEDPSS